jgi:hypothetical protein
MRESTRKLSVGLEERPPLRDQAERMKDAPPGGRTTLARCHRRLHQRTLGARFWGQVRGFSGRLRVFEGRVKQGEKW